MHFSILTLFPDFFTTPLQSSILKKAHEKNIFSYELINIRDFSKNKNKSVDDTPYGGMPGMLMKPDIVADALWHAKNKHSESEVIFFSPTGKPFTQRIAEEKATNGKNKIFLCGHYEGIDQRVLDVLVDETYSIGSAVLTGGEIPAVYALDSIVRLLPDAIGKEISHQEESFSQQFFGKGEYPQYTRPEIWNDIRVPSVLLSGNHAKIEEWKLENLQGLTPLEKKILHLKTQIFSSQKLQKNRFFALRLPHINDAKIWVDVFSDPEVTKYLRIDALSLPEEKEFLAHDAKDLSSITLSVIDLKTKSVFANVSLSFSEYIPHIATFGLVIHQSHWGKGFGTAITKHICNMAFEYFSDLQKIQLDVFTENIAAQRVYEKSGFVRVGLQKKHQLKNGEYKDIFLYEKIREQ